VSATRNMFAIITRGERGKIPARIVPFPEFEGGRVKVLFFSRGKGRGHAIPDSGIIRALEQLRPELQFRIVSYALGAKAFTVLGHDVIDVGLPETSPIAEMSVIAGRLIHWLNPDVVITHEEFAAIPASRIFDKPVIAVVEWFMDESMYSMNTLRFCREILFTGQADSSSEPSFLKGKVLYLPPVIRRFDYSSADRERARRELDMPQNAIVLSVMPGSWREEQAPILHCVAAAYDALEHPSKRLVWIAGTDRELIASAFAGRPDVRVLDTYWPMDRLMVATDVAITKSNRASIFELDALGIWSIAISFGLNPMDDAAVARLDGIPVIQGEQLTAQNLLDTIHQQLSDTRPRQRQRCITPQECAPYLLAAIDRVLLSIKDS
jgi:UDP-N-acetylglucosamine:LPS N-acetylglucosamine transferase